MHSVAENAALGMVAGLDQLQYFTSSQDFLPPLLQTPEIYLGEKPRSWVLGHQLCNRRSAITDDFWKDLFGDCEDMPNTLVREPIVKNSRFVRSWRKPLDHERCCGSV